MKRAAAVLALPCAVLAGCTQVTSGHGTLAPGYEHRVLDRHAVEDTVTTGGYTNVTCNDGQDPTIKVGARFDCTADGGKRVIVRIVNLSGDYEWSPA